LEFPQNLNLRAGIRRAGATLLAIGAALPVLAQEPVEILIRSGLIVTETGRLQADLRIRDGAIAEIGRNLTPAPGARTVDATGKLVLPGG
jgi:imidazolonepropionase-like amidohydrolase